MAKKTYPQCNKCKKNHPGGEAECWWGGNAKSAPWNKDKPKTKINMLAELGNESSGATSIVSANPPIAEMSGALKLNKPKKISAIASLDLTSFRITFDLLKPTIKVPSTTPVRLTCHCPYITSLTPTRLP